MYYDHRYQVNVKSNYITIIYVYHIVTDAVLFIEMYHPPHVHCSIDSLQLISISYTLGRRFTNDDLALRHFLPTCSTSTCFRFNSTLKGSILYTIHTTPQTMISSNPPSMPFCKTKNAIGGGKKLLVFQP